MDMSKYRDMFLHESSEHLQKMSALLVAIEKDPQDLDRIDAMFREAHSIKGMAASMGYETTARLAHHLEDGLDNCRSQGQIDSAQIDQLLAGVDLLEGLIDDIRQEQPERTVDDYLRQKMIVAPQELKAEDLVLGPEGKATESEEKAPELEGMEPEPEKDGLLIRLKLNEKVVAPGPRWLVFLKRLETLGTLQDAEPSKDEILQGKISRQLQVRLKTDLAPEMIRERLKSYRELSAIDFPIELTSTSKRKRALSSSTVRVSTDLLDHFINLTGELITNRYMLQTAFAERNWSEMNESLGQLARLERNLHHQVLQVRMMPLDSITGRLPRTVRDLCRSSGKEVNLEIEGAGLELDRAILEELSDPLQHMIRNAIDHGISQQGTVRIKAWRERDQVLIQVADDGNGINPERVKQQALDSELISPAQAQTMRDFELLQLICLPGFSTAGEVTETSGRGVGMDVVKTAVERLGGVLLIDSTLGEGARVTLKLPLSVAIIRVLMVGCNDGLMALPITRVLQTLEIEPQEVQASGKQLVISLHGELLPLLSLRKILRLPKGPARNTLSLVITEVLGRKIGLVVDSLIGQREVFVQSLPAPFDGLRGCSGGTILGDGKIMFIIDLQSLLELHRN